MHDGNWWSEAVHDFKGFPGIDGEVKKIVRTAREVGGEGFVDRIDEEVEEHIEEHQEVLANGELEDLVKSSHLQRKKNKLKQNQQCGHRKNLAKCFGWHKT